VQACTCDRKSAQNAKRNDQYVFDFRSRNYGGWVWYQLPLIHPYNHIINIFQYHQRNLNRIEGQIGAPWKRLLPELLEADTPCVMNRV
jgi:hypothetical protein